MTEHNWFIPREGPFQVTISISSTNSNIEKRDNLYDITGTIDSIDIKRINKVENISTLENYEANYMITDTETRVTLSEILKQTGENFLAKLSGIGEYVLLCITRGEQSWKVGGVVSEYVETIRRDKSIGKLTLYQSNVENSYA